MLLPVLLLLARKRGDSMPARPPEPPADTPVTTTRARPDFAVALHKLEEACHAADARAAASALLETGEAFWSEDPPRNLGTLAGRLGGDAGEQVSELDRVLYGSEAQQWNGAALWEAVRDAWKTPGETQGGMEELLEPLYPAR